MVTHTQNWCSAFNPSKCTHTQQWVVNTHRHCEHTPGAVGSHCSSAQGAIGGSVPCSREPQSWYWRWRECCSFTIPTFNPCRTWDSNPQPLNYKSDSLTTRPRLPHMFADIMHSSQVSQSSQNFSEKQCYSQLLYFEMCVPCWNVCFCFGLCDSAHCQFIQ